MSQFWKIPFIDKMIQDLGGHDVIFDSCCHGGARKKNSRFWCTADWFTGLAATCPGPDVHFHKSWTPTVVNHAVQYPTAEAGAYPKLLCQRLAEAFRAALLQQGAVDVESLQQQQAVEEASLHRFVLDALPRGKKYKPLVSEYGAYITIVHAEAVEEASLEVPVTARLIHQRFPSGEMFGLMGLFSILLQLL